MSRTPTRNLDYIRKLYAPQDALLQRIDAELNRRRMAIHIGPDEGKLLQLLITMRQIKTIVEIGTLAGYSAIWMARALPKDGHLYAIDSDPEHAALARGFFNESEVKNRISLLEGDAHKILPSLNGKAPFDMVFIDADKEGYCDYLDWAEKNIRQGGLIIADNTLLFDTVARDMPPQGEDAAAWPVMRRFNQRLADPKKYCSLLIPTQEGMTVAVKLQ